MKLPLYYILYIYCTLKHCKKVVQLKLLNKLSINQSLNSFKGVLWAFQGFFKAFKGVLRMLKGESKGRIKKLRHGRMRQRAYELSL